MVSDEASKPYFDAESTQRRNRPRPPATTPSAIRGSRAQMANRRKSNSLQLRPWTPHRPQCEPPHLADVGGACLITTCPPRVHGVQIEAYRSPGRSKFDMFDPASPGRQSKVVPGTQPPWGSSSDGTKTVPPGPVGFRLMISFRFCAGAPDAIHQCENRELKINCHRGTGRFSGIANMVLWADRKRPPSAASSALSGRSAGGVHGP